MEFMIFLDYYGNYTMDINLLDAGNIQFNISGLNELDNKKQASSVLTTSLLNYKNPQAIKIPKCDQIAMKVKVVE